MSCILQIQVDLFESQFYEDNYDELYDHDIWLNFFREYRVESFLNINSGICPSGSVKHIV